MSTIKTSAFFDDVYFSPEDGLGETRYVFIDGTELPARFAGSSYEHRIGELGFGTGLNFLVTLEEFLNCSPLGSRLTYLSCELHPLTPGEMARLRGTQWSAQLARALRWFEAFTGRENFESNPESPLDRWIRPRLPAAEGRSIALEIYLGHVDRFLEELSGPKIDTWFLDGHSPAKNPEMWSPAVFSGIARHSKPGTRLATFSAAGHVRRGLEAVGFEMKKRKGFGRKRECLSGTF